MKILGLFTAFVFCLPVTALANETVIIAEPNNVTDKATIVQLAEKIELLEPIAKKLAKKKLMTELLTILVRVLLAMK